MTQRLLVLAGGRSEEHEISIISTRSLLTALENTDIEAQALVITKTGHLLDFTASQKALEDGVATSGGGSLADLAEHAKNADMVFPLLHGPHGEDGKIQGFLEELQIPYIGCGVLASAACMDKIIFKHILASQGLEQVAYCLVTEHMYANNQNETLAKIQAIPAPWFIKPANLGSSVGISKARTDQELEAALKEAFKHDRRVIVEAGINNVRELEVALLGNQDPKASVVGEITYDADFYDYETKYTDGRAQLHIPADIPEKLVGTIQELAKEAYTLLDCAGFARADFFYDTQTEMLYLNEINTIPGFTPFSMFTKLWEASGIPYDKLVTKLMALAKENFSLEDRA
ncbi:MAG: D-alanine--D-alanine ligase family protein [Myxococcota bacterium]|nr:D-alanine--D-alanine ligase family protein [Myxococcota bacterium]